MGQHKHNPTAIAAKNGEISKEKRISKKELREWLEREIQNSLIRADVPIINGPYGKVLNRVICMLLYEFKFKSRRF